MNFYRSRWNIQYWETFNSWVQNGAYYWNRLATELPQSSWFFLPKNEIFDISQLLSKLSKYSFGSKLVIFGLELFRLSFFKILPLRAAKKSILIPFSQALWQFCARPISIICTILDWGGKGLSIKDISAKFKNSLYFARFLVTQGGCETDHLWPLRKKLTGDGTITSFFRQRPTVLILEAVADVVEKNTCVKSVNTFSNVANNICSFRGTHVEQSTKLLKRGNFNVFMHTNLTMRKSRLWLGQMSQDETAFWWVEHS